ncbi:MAG: TetR/AcrR family transcriptional regulator [Microbacterium sp.]
MTPGPARRLTQDEILDAAFGVLAARGSAALSLRGVATAVGVAPTALYTYFPSKSALMSGMVERLLEQIEDEPSDGDTARERLHALALSVHRAISDRPGAAALLISGPLDGPEALSVGERLIRSFIDAGMVAADAARASYALQVYVLGSAILASVGAEAADTHHTSLPAQVATEFPLTHATAAVAAQFDSSDQFEWGLVRTLDGLLGA